jgi:hypothetical protein
MKRALLLVLCLALAASDGVLAALVAEVKASSSTLNLVHFFLKTPTSQLPPISVEDFLRVDPETLPQKLRMPYKSKRLELKTLLHISEGKKRGFVRIPERECSPPPGSKEVDIKVLLAGGFWSEINENEEEYIMKKTNCTERDMMCEFTLQITLEKDSRTKKEKRRYFLYERDPLMVFVGEYRAGARGSNTPFFGRGGPICSH